MIFAAADGMHVTDIGRATEERGFESLFLPEHTHIPTSRRSPWRGGAELPREYKSTLDPFVALGAVAAVTRSLRLGTGVALVVQRDPVLLAKEVATLDVLSGGRVLLGVGGGWNLEEMRHHGTDPRTRWTLLRERVLAMREIWGHDVAEFHGELVDLDPLWQWPKPVQKPCPPVLVGSNSPGTLRRVLDYGDGWIPLWRGDADVLGEQMRELGRLAAERALPRPPVTVFGAPPDAAVLGALAGLGVDRCLFWLPTGGPDAVVPELDRLAALVAGHLTAGRPVGER